MASTAKKVATYEDVLNAPRDKVAELMRGTLSVVGAFKNDERVRARPFEALELELSALWER